MRKFASIALLTCSMAGCVLQMPPHSDVGPAAQNYQPQPQETPRPAVSMAGWVQIGTVESTLFQIKEGSFRFDQDTAGNAMAVVLGRTIDLSTQAISLVQWSVKARDCITERGIIIGYDMQGNPSTQNEFIFRGGSMASDVAQVICSVAADRAASMQKDQRNLPAKPKANGSAI